MCNYHKSVNRDIKVLLWNFIYDLNYLKRLVLSESLLRLFEKTGRAYSNIHNYRLDRINEI